MSQYRTTNDAINDLPLFAAARKTDPPTSKAAAARIRRAAGGHELDGRLNVFSPKEVESE